MDVTIGAGGVLPGTGMIDGLGQLPPATIRYTLANLSDSDNRKLKVACAEVLGDPGSYRGETVAICQLIAAL